MNLTPEEVIEKYSALVQSLAHKYMHSGLPFEDLYQEGLLGLLDAISHYDESKGTRFSTYATYWIKKKIFDALEREKKISLNAVTMDQNTLTSDKELSENLKEDTLKIPPDMPLEEKQVIISLYEDKKTLTEIASDLGITRERTRQLKEKALRRIRHIRTEKIKES